MIQLVANDSDARGLIGNGSIILTPVLRRQYRVGVPRGGFWKEILNSDAAEYGGSGQGNCGGAEAAPVKWHHRNGSLQLTLPPLAGLFFVSRDYSGGPPPPS